jgi:hypothetical protein
MIMAPEQAALKAQEQFDGLMDLVQKAAQDGQRIDTVERELLRRLLGLGHTLLPAFVAQQGDGDIGPEAETTGEFRIEQEQTRLYRSVAA